MFGPDDVGVIVLVPDTGLPEPVLKPVLALVQLVAPVALHVSVVDWPRIICPEPAVNVEMVGFDVQVGGFVAPLTQLPFEQPPLQATQLLPFQNCDDEQVLQAGGLIAPLLHEPFVQPP